MIGKQVTVTIDRPLGSVHPANKDILYTVNYGYVKGILAPDGEEQDAYVLGVDVPVSEFTGVVIAVIHRQNDIEDKWIVSDGDYRYTKEEIYEKVRFIERYFDIEIRM